MESNKRHYVFEVNPFHDEDGFLTVLEEGHQVPFKIKRIFYEYGVKKSSLRGKHANKNSKFCMVAVSGCCDVMIDDIISDTIVKTEYHLDSPNKVLFIDKMIWKTMTNFSKDCVLLILSDCKYDKKEYIRDFEIFKKCI